MFKELIQGDFNADTLEKEVRRISEDDSCRQMMLADYAAIRETLGGSGASEKVARAMIRELKG